ncbi:MAG: transposase [Planctomycetota bacterium]
MGRSPRVDEAGGIYHALNRGNARHDIFFKDADFEAFERIIAKGQEKFSVDLIAYQWMTNHWHMVLSPHVDGELSTYVGWVTLPHTQRYHAYHGTTGYGHVYQGRYRNFPVQDDEHFHTVCQYVERNALNASIVKRAEDYRWGSLNNWLGSDSPIELASWPIRRLPKWVERVNQALTEKALTALRHSVKRGKPFGDIDWTEATVKKFGLESTTRARGRPRKLA